MTVEGTPADRFAIEHAHYTADLAFWRALADERGGPVLDLACAVGRVAIPLARDGHEVWALDASQAMLDELAQAREAEPADVAARVHPVGADMRLFNLGRAFPLVLVPMNSLQTLLDRSDQLAALGAIRGHLEPLGELAFDLILSDLEAAAQAVGTPQPGATWTDPQTGVILAHSAWFDAVDPETGTVSFTTRIEETTPGGSVTIHLRPQTVHVYSPTEVWELVSDAGMEVRAVYADFDGRPFAGDGERHIYRCGVPG